uniref:Uncharacterized protein n=1 Tax=Anguilla anguilla TaxID=7936 RepID=A0A0E9UH82_ANGAN
MLKARCTFSLRQLLLAKEINYLP